MTVLWLILSGETGMQTQDFWIQESDGIVVSARPVLMQEDCDKKFWWGYYLCIENQTNDKIRLLGKNWKITDEAGNSYVDNTVGFKGELPELEPGEYFEFTSEAPLDFANAVFYGSCQVLREGQNVPHEVKIPTFSLSAPQLRHRRRRIVN